MVVPLAGRVIAACVGALLVITAARSVIGTVIVPRLVGSWLTRWVDKIVDAVYRMVTAPMTDHKRRDRVLAGQAAAILLGQLVAWLAIFYFGFALLMWPFAPRGARSAFSLAGPSGVGSNPAPGAGQKTIAELAPGAARIPATLHVAYLAAPSSDLNRR